MQSQEWGWGSAKTIGCLAAGVVLLVVFVLAELRIEQPLIQLRLFRSHNFNADELVLFCVELALIGLTVFGALWVQNVLGFDPIEAGLSLLPLTIPLLFIAPMIGRFTTGSVRGRSSPAAACSWPRRSPGTPRS
jgi:hypothetical protein